MIKKILWIDADTFWVNGFFVAGCTQSSEAVDATIIIPEGEKDPAVGQEVSSQL